MTKIKFLLFLYVGLDILFSTNPSWFFGIIPAILFLQVFLTLYELHNKNSSGIDLAALIFAYISLFFYAISAGFNYVINSSAIYSAWFFDKYSASSEAIALAFFSIFAALGGALSVNFKGQNIILKLNKPIILYEFFGILLFSIYFLLVIAGLKYDSIASIRDLSTIVCIIAFYFSSKKRFLILMLLVQVVDMIEGHRWRFVGYLLLAFFLHSYDSRNFRLITFSKVLIAIILFNMLEFLDLYRHGVAGSGDLMLGIEKVISFAIKQTPVSNIFYYSIDESIIGCDYLFHSIASIFYPFIKLLNLDNLCQYYGYGNSYELCRLGDIISMQLNPVLYDSGFGVGGSVFAELYPIFSALRIPATLYFIFFYCLFNIIKLMMRAKLHLPRIVVLTILPYIFFLPRDSISNFFAMAMKAVVIYSILWFLNACLSKGLRHSARDGLQNSVARTG